MHTCKLKWWTRRNEIAINVLSVCFQDTQFIYVLPRWEGLEGKGWVLREEWSEEMG